MRAHADPSNSSRVVPRRMTASPSSVKPEGLARVTSERMPSIPMTGVGLIDEFGCPFSVPEEL